MEQPQAQSINWIMMRTRIKDWQENHRGWLAELKRCQGVDDIADLPAYYRLIQGYANPGRIAERGAYLLPWLPHREGAKPIGASLRSAKISEMRLFQMMRSEYPKDIELLRRLVQQAEPTVDWGQFGPLLQYWGKNSKRRILEQYFLDDNEGKNSEGDKS